MRIPLYELNRVCELCDAVSSGNASLPVGVIAEITSVINRYTSKITDVTNKITSLDISSISSKAQEKATSAQALSSSMQAGDSSELLKKAAQASSEIDTNKKEKKKSAKEKMSDLKAQQAEEAKKKTKEFLNKQLENLKKSMNDEVDYLKEKGDSMEQAWDNFVGDLKDRYGDDGEGRKNIDNICDKINDDFDQLIQTGQKISIETPMMVAKIPTPGAIGPCVTNPAYSVQTMITDLQTILSLVLVMVNLSKSIITSFKSLNVSKMPEVIKRMMELDLASMIPSLDALDSLTSKLQQMLDAVSSIQQYVDESQSSMKQSAEGLRSPVYADGHDNDSDYIIAYKSIVLNDDLSMRGYNFYYCTTTDIGRENANNVRKNHKTVRINNWLAQHGYKSAKDVTAADWASYMSITNGASAGTYNDGDFWFFRATNDVNDHTIPTIDVEMTTATIENDNPNTENISINGSILTLASGRRIFVDGKYKSGDVIKLSDGTVVTIK